MDSILLHIGYHKTGSGWLRRLFFTNPATGFGSVGKRGKRHPSRRLVRARPFQFDAASYRAEFDPLLEPIAREGLVPVVAYERFSGHPFSGGYDSKVLADRLHAVFPEGRVLVVIREQRSMINSTYNQYVREGGAWTIESFLAPPASKSLRVPWVDLRHFEYHHLIRYYQQLFGRDRVLVLAFEHFARDAEDFVDRVAEFGGRPLTDELRRTLPFEHRSNPAPPAVTLNVLRRLNKLGVRTDINPAALLDSKRVLQLAEWIEDTMRAHRGFARRRDEALKRVIAEHIGNRYVESNRITAELTGIDLKSYGWDA